LNGRVVNGLPINRRILQTLLNVAYAVSQQWGRTKNFGWYDSPHEKVKETVDIVATSDAVDILAQIYGAINNALSILENPMILAKWKEIKTDVENSIIDGTNILLKELSNLEKSTRTVADLTISFFLVIRALTSVIKLSPYKLNIDFNLLKEKTIKSLHKLFELFQDQETGAFVTGGKRTSIYVTAFAIWTACELIHLIEFGDASLERRRNRDIRHAVIWLLRNRMENGSFSYFQEASYPSVSRTALSLLALESAGSTLLPPYLPQELMRVELPYEQALWLINKQRKDGSWSDPKRREDIPDVESSSLVLLALLRAGISPTNKRISDGINWLLDRVTEPIAGWNLFGERDKYPSLGPSTCLAVRCLAEFMNKIYGNKFIKAKPVIKKIKFPKFLYVNQIKDVIIEVAKVPLVPITVFVDAPFNKLKLEGRQPVFIMRDEHPIKIAIKGLTAGQENIRIVVENIITGEKDQKECHIYILSSSFGAFVDALLDDKTIAIGIILVGLLASLFKFPGLIDILWQNFPVILITFGVLLLIAFIRSRFKHF
jgi:hypothetical protein